MTELCISERQACRALGQHRSTQRKTPTTPDDEVALTADIIELARYGYRWITALLRRAGWTVNNKRVDLRRWHHLEIAKTHFVEWNGKPVASVKTAFSRAVNAAGLAGGACCILSRHTAATWLMQNGTPMWQAAGFLGMTEKTLQEVYGHHHPDYMGTAAENWGRRPNKPPAKSKRPVETAGDSSGEAQ